MRKSCRKVSPSCGHQPRSIVPAAVPSDCWGGAEGGQQRAGGSYRDLPKPQLSGSSGFSSPGSPILIRGEPPSATSVRTSARRSLNPCGARGGVATRGAPGRGWKRRRGAQKPVQQAGLPPPGSSGGRLAAQRIGAEVGARWERGDQVSPRVPHPHLPPSPGACPASSSPSACPECTGPATLKEGAVRKPFPPPPLAQLSSSLSVCSRCSQHGYPVLCICKLLEKFTLP